MADTTRDVLIRLKRRLGRERGRFERLYREASSPLTKERAFGESNICSFAMGLIDAEISKLPGETT